MSNELKKEKSPYLLQHQDNPVWWKSWSESSFKKAKAENKVVFLSIGYATCHWCHVMERECFEDQEVADLLNRSFVAIKVDREELPDVDQIYMNALHAMGQRGGWPLNMFLTPDLKPFYGGTYFPKTMFMNLLDRINALWSENPQQVSDSSERLTEVLREQTKGQASGESIHGEGPFDHFSDHCRHQFDETWGGFGSAPKFPPSSQISMLLRLGHRRKDPQLLRMAEVTLQRMAQGGIYDHLGGGFARYSVDERWEIPHFEKMLYVNALLAKNYLEAFQITQNAQYLNVAKDTLEYLLRDMRAAGGGFFSAEDADSEGHEGLFYVWKKSEIMDHLTPAEANLLVTEFGVTEEGNFEGGTNHLWISGSSFWAPRQKPEFSTLREKLLAVRDHRERPFLDDKQLTSWNGLTLSALALAARVTGEAKFLEAAKGCASFIKRSLYVEGGLCRRYRDGVTSYRATLEDYAYLISGLIELYRTNFDESLLFWARDLQSEQDLHLESADGAYFLAPEDPSLILRPRELGDGATPSANSISIENLIVLSHYFLDSTLSEKARRLLQVSLSGYENYPTAFSSCLLALDLFQANRFELVINDFGKKSQLDHLMNRYSPYLFLAKIGKEGSSRIPLAKGKHEKSFYLCESGICHAPTDSWSQIEASILRT